MTTRDILTRESRLYQNSGGRLASRCFTKGISRWHQLRKSKIRVEQVLLWTEATLGNQRLIDLRVICSCSITSGSSIKITNSLESWREQEWIRHLECRLRMLEWERSSSSSCTPTVYDFKRIKVVKGKLIWWRGSSPLCQRALEASRNQNLTYLRWGCLGQADVRCFTASTYEMGAWKPTITTWKIVTNHMPPLTWNLVTLQF